MLWCSTGAAKLWKSVTQERRAGADVNQTQP